jgi:Uma2 family endonuclease
VINGKASPRHNEIIRILSEKISEKIRRSGKDCILLQDPQLFIQSKEYKNGPVPDIAILCKNKKFNEERGYFEGPADIVIEVVSPSSYRNDLEDKKNIYLASGVMTYILIGSQKNKEFIKIYENVFRLKEFLSGDIVDFGDGSLSFTYDELYDEVYLFDEKIK